MIDTAVNIQGQQFLIVNLENTKVKNHLDKMNYSNKPQNASLLV